jgi:hypothetical protein
MSDKPSSGQWYVRTKTGASGPYSTDQIREFAGNGKLPRTAQLGKSPEGPWGVAESAKGLFPDPPSEELTAGDLVPEAVRNSASAVTSAAGGIARSLVSQVKNVSNGLANRAEAAVTTITAFCEDGQDPAATTKIAQRVKELCIRDEDILYIAVQSKPVANFMPDAIVLTNKRFMVFRPKIMGRMTFTDCLWKDCKDVHVEENIFGATLTLTQVDGRIEKLDYIPKSQARMIYRHAQEQEEIAFNTRRNMKIEEIQAGADRTVINQAIGTQSHAQPAIAQQSAIDPVARLTQLKQLLDAGIIDQSEFDIKKSEIMKLI